MRIILSLIKKEFLQIFRNRVLTIMVFSVPIIQLVILVLATNLEISDLSLGFIDKDNSTTSHSISNTLTSSDYFILEETSKDYDQALMDFETDKSDVIIEIPANFERDLARGEKPRVIVSVNAINSMKAGVAASYISEIFMQISSEIAVDMQHQPQTTPRFNIIYSEWYNPLFNYESFMIPGVLCVLITVIGMLLTTLNIVREKEIGTIEQINVTPITKIEFILGKILPFGIIGVIQLTFGLITAYFVFGLEIQGDLWLLYSIVAIYLFAILGLGFLISTIAETESQAMFIALFFMFLFILLGGLFTPIESMPSWAQNISFFNPTAHMINAVRLIILKGSNFADIQTNFLMITISAILINIAVILKYKKTS